jgi:hypothetical protein
VQFSKRAISYLQIAGGSIPRQRVISTGAFFLQLFLFGETHYFGVAL